MFHRARPKFAIAIKMDTSMWSRSILTTAVRIVGGETPIGVKLTTLGSFLRLSRVFLKLYVPLVKLERGFSIFDNNADPSGAQLDSAQVSKARLAYIILTDALYAPAPEPPDPYVAGIKGLTTIMGMPSGFT
jgi:hypothetical protein